VIRELVHAGLLDTIDLEDFVTVRPPLAETDAHLRSAHAELMSVSAVNRGLEGKVKACMDPMMEAHQAYQHTWEVEVKKFNELMKKRLNDKRKKKGKLGKQIIPKGASNKSVYNPHAAAAAEEEKKAAEEKAAAEGKGDDKKGGAGAAGGGAGAAAAGAASDAKDAEAKDAKEEDDDDTASTNTADGDAEVGLREAKAVLE
jgi:hypothetical protein